MENNNMDIEVVEKFIRFINTGNVELGPEIKILGKVFGG